MSLTLAAPVQPATGTCTLCGQDFALVPGTNANGKPIMVVPPHTAPEPPPRPRWEGYFQEGPDYYGLPADTAR